MALHSSLLWRLRMEQGPRVTGAPMVPGTGMSAGMQAGYWKHWQSRPESKEWGQLKDLFLSVCVHVCVYVCERQVETRGSR